MAGFCAAPVEDAGLVQSLLGSVDCNVLNMVETGYASLTQPGSAVSAALTILLTLYIAILGFRLMVGRAPLRVGDLTLTLLKIGVILVLATSWPTYQQLVFDTLFRGPEQLASGMMQALQPTGSIFRRDPLDGLQIAYDELQRSAQFFSQRVVGQASPLQGGNAFGALALNLSSFVMLMTTLGAVLSAKIVLGLLLALGPVFVAFLLFDATRGLFEGWLRASVGFALVPLIGLLSLVGQLTLIEPHLVRLAEARGQGIVDLAPANAIFILTLVFAVVSIAGAIAVGIIAVGFRLPWGQAAPPRELGAAQASQVNESLMARSSAQSEPTNEVRSRVSAVAAAAAAMDRRDSLSLGAGQTGRLIAATRRSGDGAVSTISLSPVSQTYRRSAQPRRAASSVRRDR